jgi:nitrogen fixation NifU-like protein
MDEIYRDEILDHYERPRHYGTLAHADMAHTEKNALCGDIISFEVQLSPDQRRIVDVAFQGRGCVISQAAASMLAETVAGKEVTEVEAIDQQAMLDMLGVPLTLARRKCALLGLRALKTSLYRLQAAEARRS